MISKRPQRLSSRMILLAVYTIIAVVHLVSADNDINSSLSSLIKGQDNTNNTPNDEPAARLLKEKMKVDTNRDLQSDSAANDGTYTINALASRLSKPGQNQGRQANFKRRKNNGGDKNTSNRQSSGSGGSGRERQTDGGVGAARNEGRKNRNSNKPQQQGTANNQKNRKPAASGVKSQGNRQNKPVGIHGPQKPQQQQKKNNVRNKNDNNNTNGTRRKKKVPMAAQNSNLVVVKNKQKITNAGKRIPNTTAGNARNSHANSFMTTLYGSSGGGKSGGGKGNMRNKNGGGGKKKNNGRKRRNGGKNAWSTPTWSVDEKKVWDAGWGTEGIYKPSSSNGWGGSSGSKDSWTDDGWTRADWIELPKREECPCVMVDNPEYIAAQWSSSGQWEPIWGTVEDSGSSSNVQPAWGEPTWMTQQAWGPSWSDTSWAAPAWETQSTWGGTWNGGPVIKASSSSSYTSPWSSSAWWGGRKQRRLDATGTKSRKRRRRRLGSKSSGGKGGGGKSNDNDKSSRDSGDTVEVKQASAWSSSAWEATEKIPEKIKVCTCMPTVSTSSKCELVYPC